jgi:hypothetical protein
LQILRRQLARADRSRAEGSAFWRLEGTVNWISRNGLPSGAEACTAAFCPRQLPASAPHGSTERGRRLWGGRRCRVFCCLFTFNSGGVGSHRCSSTIRAPASSERFRHVSQEQALYSVSKTREEIVKPRKYRKPRRGPRRQESRRAGGGRCGGRARGRALRRKYPADTDTTFHAASTCPANADNASPGLKSWQHRADAVRRRQCPQSSF